MKQWRHGVMLVVKSKLKQHRYQINNVIIDRVDLLSRMVIGNGLFDLLIYGIYRVVCHMSLEQVL